MGLLASQYLGIGISLALEVYVGCLQSGLSPDVWTTPKNSPISMAIAEFVWELKLRYLKGGALFLFFLVLV